MLLLALILLPVICAFTWLLGEMAWDKRQFRKLRKAQSEEKVATSQSPMARLQALKTKAERRKMSGALSIFRSMRRS